jgi:hypothetical protein
VVVVEHQRDVMADVKGRCVCGKQGTVRAVVRHSMQCDEYRSLHRTDPTAKALDVVWAWRYSQSEQGQMESASALQDARDERGLARREHNEHALAVSRSRWTDGKGGFADGVPVSMPDSGLIEVRSPAGSARAEVEGVSLTGW